MYFYTYTIIDISLSLLISCKEWWGMNDQIKQEAEEIGEMGKFVTLVPDLYRGKIATDTEQAGHLMGELDWPGAVKDIQGAAKYLLENGCTKVRRSLAFTLY
jgi:carboxymethylenebutenolidase